MPVSRKINDPATVTNTSGEPEIVLEIDGLVLSMKPPVTGRDAAEPPSEGDSPTA